jgi:hypothetical protein
MVGIHQSSGSSPPNRPKVSKRDRERLSRLDRKIHKLKECMKFAKNCNLPFSRYETSIFKFDIQRKLLRNKMKGYANKT